MKGELMRAKTFASYQCLVCEAFAEPQRPEEAKYSVLSHSNPTASSDPTTIAPNATVSTTTDVSTPRAAASGRIQVLAPCVKYSYARVVLVQGRKSLGELLGQDDVPYDFVPCRISLRVIQRLYPRLARIGRRHPLEPIAPFVRPPTELVYAPRNRGDVAAHHHYVDLAVREKRVQHDVPEPSLKWSWSVADVCESPCRKVVGWWANEAGPVELRLGKPKPTLKLGQVSK